MNIGSVNAVNYGHLCLQELAISVADQKTANPTEVAKLVCSLAHLNMKVEPLLRRLPDFLGEHSLKRMDVMTVLYFCNALVKLNHRDVELMTRTALAFEV